jgi:cytochrome c peroxidase
MFRSSRSIGLLCVLLIVTWSGFTWACSGQASADASLLEADNPIRPIPDAPLGSGIVLQLSSEPPTPARVRLGRWLFFEHRLSSDGTVACASCHQPEYGFSQATPVATGVGGHRGRRKVPPILNLATTFHVNFKQKPQATFFWDGRATSLEGQALQPVVNPDEMGSTDAAMLKTLSRIDGYHRYFEQAFGDSRITRERVARALADYERTRVSGNSPFDRWHSGHDATALSDGAKRGYELFTGKGECAHCHAPPLFGGGFHNTGIGWDRATHTFADQGRHLITKGTIDEDWPGTFKAPTLREVARRAPYMHDGSIHTLREVVEYYNRGANPNPWLSAFIHPLGLTPAEMDDLVAFLEALNGEGWQDRGPTRFPQ